VAPGMINTQMSRQMMPDDKAKNIQNTLLGRAGEPVDVTSVVVFLVSPLASYLTGTTIDINGGMYIR